MMIDVLLKKISSMETNECNDFDRGIISGLYQSISIMQRPDDAVFSRAYLGLNTQDKNDALASSRSGCSVIHMSEYRRAHVSPPNQLNELTGPSKEANLILSRIHVIQQSQMDDFGKGVICALRHVLILLSKDHNQEKGKNESNDVVVPFSLKKDMQVHTVQ